MKFILVRETNGASPFKYPMHPRCVLHPYQPPSARPPRLVCPYNPYMRWPLTTQTQVKPQKCSEAANIKNIVVFPRCCTSSLLVLTFPQLLFVFSMASCKWRPLRPSSENCRMCSCYRTATTATRTTTSWTRTTTTTTRNNINTNTVAQIESLLNAINIWWLTRLHPAPPRPVLWPVLVYIRCIECIRQGIAQVAGSFQLTQTNKLALIVQLYFSPFIIFFFFFWCNKSCNMFGNDRDCASLAAPTLTTCRGRVHRRSIFHIICLFTDRTL